jgi:hypothetical protein
MNTQSLQDQIIEAIEEARILECAMERYSNDRMLFTAQKLSGAPYSFVQEVFSKKYKKTIDLSI